MKSIIEQASSIMKAIEKAWDQADKPKEFSVKIFEKEEKNFFGLTSKPAKIGIFFTDKLATPDKPIAQPRQEIKECRTTTKPHPSHPREQSRTNNDRPSTNKQSHQTEKKTVQAHTNSPLDNDTRKQSIVDKPHRPQAAWNDAMINIIISWLKQTLSLMGMNNISFTTEIAGKNLKLTFNIPLIADVIHEKQLFRSFAHLIMSSLRNQYKQEMRDLKVIFIRPE